MLGSLKIRCPSLSEKLSRGYLTQRPHKKEEWWAVDGEIFKAEEFDPKRVLEPSPNEQVSNKKRRKDRIRQLAQTRLKLRTEGQESYWAAYIRRYQIMRDEWEKLVWDPKPVPQPRGRNPSLVRQDAERYVWRDPRRDNYDNQDPMNSRMARVSNIDIKTASRARRIDRYPDEGQRNSGASTSKFGAPYQSYANKGGFYKTYADGHKSEQAFRGIDQSHGNRVRTDIKRASGIQQENRIYRHDKYESSSREWSKQDAKEGKLNWWSEDAEEDGDSDDDDDDDDNIPSSIKRGDRISESKERYRNERYKHKTKDWSEDEDEDDDDEDEFADEDDDDGSDDAKH